jgi:hypothetical protein
MHQRRGACWYSIDGISFSKSLIGYSVKQCCGSIRGDTEASRSLRVYNGAASGAEDGSPASLDRGTGTTLMSNDVDAEQSRETDWGCSGVLQQAKGASKEQERAICTDTN